MKTPLQKAAQAVIDKFECSHPLISVAVLELRKALDAGSPQVLEPSPTTRPLTPEEAEMLLALGFTGNCVRVLAFNDRPAE